jgi:hypothetical protein
MDEGYEYRAIPRARRRFYSSGVRPNIKPDPDDFSQGLEAWEEAVVACAAFFAMVRVGRGGGYSKISVPSFPEVEAILSTAGDRESILVYAVTAQGR